MQEIRGDPNATAAGLWRHTRDRPDTHENHSLHTQIAELTAMVETQGIMLRRVVEALEVQGKGKGARRMRGEDMCTDGTGSGGSHS